jgi:hypothetical protein
MANIRFHYTNLLEAANVFLLNGPAVVIGAVNNNVNGSNQVTRGSGSYITDGVRRWSLLGGTLATKFPAGTRVTNIVDALTITVSNTSNQANATSSGTFTPTNAADELSSNPMSFMLTPDRRVPWITSLTPPSLYYVEFDLGSPKSVLNVSAHNMIVQSNTVVTISSGSVYGTWTNINTFSINTTKPDGGIIFTSAVSARFWRIEFLGPTLQYSVGRINFGVVQQDMGKMFSPGTVRSSIKNRVRVRSEMKIDKSFYYGRNLRAWQFNYSRIQAVDRTKLEAVFDQKKPVILIDENSAFYEVDAPEDRTDFIQSFIDSFNNIFTVEELV